MTFDPNIPGLSGKYQHGKYRVGNPVREIRNRPVNTGKYLRKKKKKKLLNGYFTPIKKISEIKNQSLTHTPKNRLFPAVAKWLD